MAGSEAWEISKTSLGLVVPIPTIPDESIANLLALLFVVSWIAKIPLSNLILKSELLLLSVKNISGLVPVIVISPEPKLPVVTIFCEPKSGEIFVPAIAALAFISAFTIAPSTIFALVTLLSAGSLTPRLLNVRIKKSAPVAGASPKIISLPETLKP